MPYLWTILKKTFVHVGLFTFSSCCSPLKLQSEILAVDWWPSLDAQFCGWLHKLTNRISACSIFIYGNVSLLFLLDCFHFELCVTKNGNVSKKSKKYQGTQLKPYQSQPCLTYPSLKSSMENFHPICWCLRTLMPIIQKFMQDCTELGTQEIVPQKIFWPFLTRYLQSRTSHIMLDTPQILAQSCWYAGHIQHYRYVFQIGF